MSAKQTSQLKSAAIAILVVATAFYVGMSWPDEFEVVGSFDSEYRDRYSHAMGYQNGRDPYLFAPTLPAVYEDEDGPTLDDGYGFGNITAFGEIYVAGNATPQDFADTLPTKLTQFEANGKSHRVDVDYTDHSLTIALDGTYVVAFHSSFEGSAGTTFTMHIRVDAVEMFPGLHRSMMGPGSAGSASFEGHLDLMQDDVVTVYVESDMPNKSITIIDGVLSVSRVL